MNKYTSTLPSDNNNIGEGSLGGRIALSVFFFIFFSMGMLFTAFLARETAKIVGSYFWPKTEADVSHSDVVRRSGDGDDESPYVIDVDYSYYYQGVSYKSSKVSFAGGKYGSYEAARDALKNVLSGGVAYCYVNPADPSEAILEHGSPWIILFLPIPLVFVAVGAIGLLAIWKRSWWGATAQSEGSIARKAKKKVDSRKALLVLGIILTVVGALLTMTLSSRIISQLSALNWDQVTATVISSGAVRHESTDDDGHTSVTWHPDIFYSYTYGGVDYKASRYDYLSISSSNRAKVGRVLGKYKAGRQTVAYVDPDNPEDAVLSRQINWSVLLYCIPLLVLLLGVGLLKNAWFKRDDGHSVGDEYRRAVESNSPVSNPTEDYKPGSTTAQTDPATGYFVLAQKIGHVGKFVAVLFFAVFWNGIVALFLSEASKSWFLTLFLVPFVLVGLLLIGLCVYQFLAIFNPRVIVKVNSVRPHLGETVEVFWEIVGDAKRLSRLSLRLCGREEATYQRGTSTMTAKSQFAALPVGEQSSFFLKSGRGSVTIPVGTMHSFAARSNKVIWEIEVEGVIPFWPNVIDSYELTVKPLQKEALERSGGDTSRQRLQQNEISRS